MPIYHSCTELLKESLSGFELAYDRYAGIEKLTYYYNLILPMVAISLMPNPIMKNDYLRTHIDWNGS